MNSSLPSKSEIGLSEQDEQDLALRKITTDQFYSQLGKLERGSLPIALEKCASLNDGIQRFSDEDSKKFADLYIQALDKIEAEEFIPASGAATRMFQALFYVRDLKKKNEALTFDHLLELAQANEEVKSFLIFFQRIKNFPFWNLLKSVMHNAGLDPEKLWEEKSFDIFMDYLLFLQGLNFSELPKALIPFQNHPTENRPVTAFELHLQEAAELLSPPDVSNSQKLGSPFHLHFTVSAEHENKIRELIEELSPSYAKKNIGFEFQLTQQNSSSDTVAVDEKNIPLRNADGALIFRPGGHGALLENLNLCDKQIIFIKNIDNVMRPSARRKFIQHRRTMAGYLIHIRQKIIGYLNTLDELEINGPQDQTAFSMNEIKTFIEENLGLIFSVNLPITVSVLKNILNRPLRVCAMVRNEGEPGGGPFWVRFSDGSLRLQIVETAQVNKNLAEQIAIAASSTHFNPTDIACCILDRNDKPFDLRNYVDEDAYLITTKSKNGKTVKALELPGLWNGSMAHWNTVFIEADTETFNPAKTIIDLLKLSHRGQ